MPINFRFLASNCVVIETLGWCFPLLPMGQVPANANSQEFVDAFMATERAKLIDKVQRQGNDFDSSREFEKLQKKHLKVFGTPLPAERYEKNFDEFSKWDSNGDGLLEPREVLRVTRPPTPPSNAKSKRPGSK